MKSQKRLKDGDKLWRWAEKLLSSRNDEKLQVGGKEIKNLIRQLQTFSSDLELRNEELMRTQSELEETAQKYVDSYDFSPVGYFTVTKTGSIVEANVTGAKLLGVERDRLHKRTFTEFVAPGFQAAYREHRLRIIEKEKKQRIEIKLIRKDKTSFDASIESIPVPGSRIRCAVSDITERKQAEEGLKKSKERFEILSETASRLLATNKPQEVVNELCQKVMAFLNCHAFFNYLVDEEKGRLHLNAYAGIPKETGNEIEWLDYGVAVCGCAAQDASRIVCENIPETPDPRTELVKSFGIKAYACHPLFSAGRVIGTLSFGTRSRTTFSNEELSLMKTVADQVAMAMERIQLINALRKSRDELEVRVQERTAELMDAVEELQDEISERKRAENAVEAARQRFNDVLEMLPVYVILLTQDHHVRFANRFFRERFGESFGRRCFEYLFGRNEPCENCDTYTVAKTNVTHHWEWTGPDGRIYDIHDFPFTDTDGSPLILEMGIDITERKRAEEALREASRYNRSLIEASLDPLVTISAEGRVMDVNRATELVTGTNRQELIGSDFSDYFTDPVKAKEGYQQVFTEGTVRDYPLAIRHTSGKVTDVLYHAAVYRNEAGEIQGVFAAARDITERKRAEEALCESEARLKYLSSQLLTVQENERKSIAREVHDSLGQSLSAIKFKVESVITDMRESGHKEIVKSLETIVPIIQTSLEEARRIQMDLRPSVLDDLGILPTLDWFCRDYQKIYSHIRIEKETHIKESDLSPELKTVIYRVTQEAMNNIAKHSKANLVHLSLNKKENKIELTIRDNGIGFDLEQVIDREASKRGLGLTSMRERIQLSGGSFVIESTLGQGTTVSAIWTLS